MYTVERCVIPVVLSNNKNKLLVHMYVVKNTTIFLILLLLLQSALQPLWVLACSTIIEYSQQEGFYRVPLPATRQTPNLEDQ